MALLVLLELRFLVFRSPLDDKLENLLILNTSCLFDLLLRDTSERRVNPGSRYKVLMKAGRGSGLKLADILNYNYKT